MTRIVSVGEQLRNLARVLDRLPLKDRNLVQSCIDKAVDKDTRRLSTSELERLEEIWRENCP